MRRFFLQRLLLFLPTLLGAVTLEAFLLAVDPVHETLVPVEGLRISRHPV